VELLISGHSIMARVSRFRRRRPARRLRKAKRKARVSRSLVSNPQNQGATIIETIVVKNAAVTNSQVGLNIFDISQFVRAQQTAALYKFYKADWCEWEYQPRYNLYGQGGTATVPYMYSAMNRTQDANIGLGPGTAQQFLTTQGAVPRKFTSKIVIRYRPNWCSPGLIAVRPDVTAPYLTGVASQGHRINYGWLASPDNAYTAGSVNTVMTIAQGANPVPLPNGYASAQSLPQATQYNGHYTWFDDSTTTETPCGDIVLRVKWSFKNPSFFVTGPRDPGPTGPTGEYVP